MKHSRFRLHIKKEFIIVRLVRDWNRLLREAVHASFLKVQGKGWTGR